MAGAPVIEIRRTPGKFIAILAGSIAVAIAGLLAAFSGLLPIGAFGRGVALVAALLAGLGGAIAALRLSQLSAPVVTITADGIRDTRIAPQMIAWSDIEAILAVEKRGGEVTILSVKPDVENALSLTAIARWDRNPHRGPPSQGLAVSAAGLDMDRKTLAAIIAGCFAKSRMSAEEVAPRPPA